MFLGKFPDVRIKLVHQGFHCFPWCLEVGKINELSFVFKSLEKKNFGACRSSDRCLLECNSDYWLHYVVVTIDGKYMYLMLSYQNLTLKSGFKSPTLLNIGGQQMHDLNLLKKKISSLWDVVAHWLSR